MSVGHEADSRVVPDNSAAAMEEAHPVNRNQDDTPEGGQSPEELVRTETKFVQYFRSATIALLIVEAVTAGLIIYRLAAKQQTQAFHKDFDAVSSLIVQGFSERLDRLLWDSYTLSIGIRGLIAASTQSAPNITIPIFDELALSAIAASKVDRVVWSPYVANEKQRLEFEAYAKLQPKSSILLLSENATAGDIFTIVGNGSLSSPAAAESAPYFPVWQVAPWNQKEKAILYDQYSDPSRNEAMQEMILSKSLVVSQAFNGSQPFYDLVDDTSNVTNVLRSVMFYPVVEADSLLGSVSFDFTWETLLDSVLPPKSNDIVIVLENTQGQAFTFSCGGPTTSFLALMGEGDLHNSQYDGMVQESTFQIFDQFRQQVVGVRSNQTQNLGDYKISVYPGEAYQANHESNTVLSFTLAPVVFLFIFTICTFLLYDCIVKKRQIKVMASAQASGAIVSSLFPAAVRDRLLASAQHDQDVTGELSPHPESAYDSKPTFLPRLIETPKLRLKRFLKSNPAASGPMTIRSDEEPIADLFHNTTVLFADIAGFTAWSSEREPPQVFKLLETLYSAFDHVANTLGVFKVETIGDCYVAVTGLPERQADHAVRMAKFANAIILKMQDLTKTLESSLGPSTANLSIRVGLHSGPVTAGVLRGQKARFQLFGDTINTASRMESTGNVSKIQISQTTADLLVEAGHSSWLTPRQELLSVKGKGEMQTYWINSAMTIPPGQIVRRTSSLRSEAEQSFAEAADAWGKGNFNDNTNPFKVPGKTRLDRLVDWNTDLLFNYLSQIIAKRLAEEGARFAKFKAKRFDIKGSVSRDLELNVGDGFPIDEITDTVSMPATTSASIKKLAEKELIDLTNVRSQLRHYVGRIASMYRSNPFHCFEHASHVVMSACKLLKRIVTPEDIDYEKKGIKALSEVIHHSTFGISSDPLLQFAVVFSALIHDVDHRGVPNAQLIQDRDEMAIKFNNKSVAEQHSLQVAWNLLMEEHYSDLRACIYGGEKELVRFRQLLVNAVLATDIADQSQITIRKKRWEKAFHCCNGHETCSTDDNDRKASLVLEYIIQASDVAHTMQHWHVFIKWNERLFEERYGAYAAGRCSQDPSVCWYQDEIWFFDSYIIPLAKKLSECGVFGVSSEEYLTYALENRREWEEKGRQWVAQMVGAQAKAA